ncbi:hypothetical protein ABEB36_006992 [Hypothenemus hampei]|uniref:Uncharacterized protein n=1 Tax=Hypothenemus hampei TaxID=57062 RepID=A0ABD1EWD4_HYPHA
MRYERACSTCNTSKQIDFTLSSLRQKAYLQFMECVECALECEKSDGFCFRLCSSSVRLSYVQPKPARSQPKLTRTQPKPARSQPKLTRMQPKPARSQPKPTRTKLKYKEIVQTSRLFSMLRSG